MDQEVRSSQDVCVPCRTVMSASGLRVSLPQDRAVLELVKALVLLLLTLSVCTAVITLPQCSLSECKRKLKFSLLCCTTVIHFTMVPADYDTDEKAYYALNCGSGRLYALPCTEHSQGFTYRSYRCSDGSEEVSYGLFFVDCIFKARCHASTPHTAWGYHIYWAFRCISNPWLELYCQLGIQG